MDRLEELIKGNKEFFDKEEPSALHFEKFEQKLDKRFKRKKKIVWNSVLKIAAITIFVLLVSENIYQRIQKPTKQQTIAAVSPEYKEAEIFYQTSIKENQSLLETYFTQGVTSPKEQQVIKDELKDLEALYQELLKDLDANPTDERVISAILEYYQMKLDMLNKIVSELKVIKTLNTGKDAKEVI